jgi:hypothetical protein
VFTGDVGGTKARVAGAELSERRCRETAIEGLCGLLDLCGEGESAPSLRAGGSDTRDDSWGA